LIEIFPIILIYYDDDMMVKLSTRVIPFRNNPVSS